MSDPNPGLELRDLAKEYLDKEIMPEVIDLLIAGNHISVKLHILGAVDSLFADGHIDKTEAFAVYQKLGIPLKAMFKIRTDAKIPQ